MSRQPNSTAPSGRVRRTPLSGRSRLSVRNQEPGYVYRIVNTNLDNDPERVQSLLEQGYEIVPREKSGPIGDKRVDNSSSLGSSSEISVGQGTKAIVMRIREDWYKEDQAIKQSMVDQTEQTMRKEKADYGDVKLG